MSLAKECSRRIRSNRYLEIRLSSSHKHRAQVEASEADYSQCLRQESEASLSSLDYKARRKSGRPRLRVQ